MLVSLLELPNKVTDRMMSSAGMHTIIIISGYWSRLAFTSGIFSSYFKDSFIIDSAFVLMISFIINYLFKRYHLPNFHTEC